MSSILIIVIEFLIIIILSLALKGYGIERYTLKKELTKRDETLDSNMIQYSKELLKQANVVRLKLSQELYRGSFKKNKVVKESCTRFYEELLSRLS